MKNSLVAAIAFLWLSLFSGVVAAQVVLTVERDGAPEIARSFTLAELKAMPQFEIRTANEFIDGVRRFRGPRISYLLRICNADGAASVRMIALNDYEVEVQVSEFDKYQPILALTMDGKELSVRDKGPIWVIYPMSDFSELRDPVFNSRLVWQLDKILYR
ncbi:MAG: hypothetical protein Q9M41_01135 [Paracoccaceae bacterium]|nr:hypothetical protein [Paracoccaceae bacterium]